MFGVKTNAYKLNSAKTPKDVFNILINETHDETLALEGFKAAVGLSHGNRKVVHGNNTVASIVSYDEATTYLDTAGNIFTISPDMLNNREVVALNKAIRLTSEAITKKQHLSILIYNNGIWRLIIQLNNDSNKIIYKASFIYKNGTHGSSELELLDYNNGEKTAVASILKIPKDIEDKAVAFHSGLIKYKENSRNKSKSSSKTAESKKKTSETINKNKELKQKKISYKDYLFNTQMGLLQNPETGKWAIFESKEELIEALRMCDDYNAICKKRFYEYAKRSIEKRHFNEYLIDQYGKYLASINKHKDIRCELEPKLFPPTTYGALEDSVGIFIDAFENKYRRNKYVYYGACNKEKHISSLLVNMILSDSEKVQYETAKNTGNFEEIEKYISLASERLAKKLVKQYEQYCDYKGKCTE